MCVVRILFVRTAVSDVRLHLDQRRFVGHLRCMQNRCFDLFDIVPVMHRLHVPAVGFEPGTDIFRKGQIRTTVDTDIVVVVQINDIPQFQMTGQRCRFGRDPFHQTAVSANTVNVIIKNREIGPVERCREIFLCDRHSDAVGKSLSQRTGGGFYSRRVSEFRMAGRFAPKLPEFF